MQLQHRRNEERFSSMHLSLQDCHSSVLQSISKNTVAAAYFHCYAKDLYKIIILK